MPVTWVIVKLVNKGRGARLVSIRSHSALPPLSHYCFSSSVAASLPHSECGLLPFVVILSWDYFLYLLLISELLWGIMICLHLLPSQRFLLRLRCCCFFFTIYLFFLCSYYDLFFCNASPSLPRLLSPRLSPSPTLLPPPFLNTPFLLPLPSSLLYSPSSSSQHPFLLLPPLFYYVVFFPAEFT